GIEANAGHRALMLQSQNDLPCRQVPDLDLTKPRRGEPFTVRTETYAMDPRRPLLEGLFAAKARPQMAMLPVPQLFWTFLEQRQPQGRVMVLEGALCQSQLGRIQKSLGTIGRGPSHDRLPG